MTGVTCKEGLVDGNAGPFSPPRCQRHLVLCVRGEVSQMVLGVSRGQLHQSAIGGVQARSVGDGDPIHLSHGLEPGHQRSGVSHITNIHLAWAIDH